jgi:hypothetical protein
LLDQRGQLGVELRSPGVELVDPTKGSDGASVEPIADVGAAELPVGGDDLFPVTEKLAQLRLTLQQIDSIGIEVELADDRFELLGVIAAGQELAEVVES